MTNHPYKGGGFAHVTHICMRNCGVRKNSPQQLVKCDKNVVYDELLLITPTALEAPR